MTECKKPNWVTEGGLDLTLSPHQEAVLMALAEELKENPEPLEITQSELAKIVNEYGILDKALNQTDISAIATRLQYMGLIGDAKNGGRGHIKAYFVTSAGFSHAGIMPSYEPRKASLSAAPSKRKDGRTYTKITIKDLGDDMKLISLGHGRFEGTRPGPDGSVETKAWTKSISRKQAIKEWEAWALPKSSAPEQWLVLESWPYGSRVLRIVTGKDEALKMCRALEMAAQIRCEKLIYSIQNFYSIPVNGDAR